MSASEPSAGAPSPRWLADEMVGRLGRYLRFLGHDTEYVRRLSDDEVAERARSEARVLLTRDRELAGRVPGALLLTSPDLAEQLRAVRRAFPAAGYEVRFVRCSVCNGELAPWTPPAAPDAWPAELPRERVEGGLEVFACRRCGHRFWEGSHTERIRALLREWLTEPDR